MSEITADRIQNNPKYHQLIKQRDALSWSLSAVVFVIYFGFTLMIAYAPAILTEPISADSVIPVGMLIGVGVILVSILLTALYVNRANSVFDSLTDEIIQESLK